MAGISSQALQFGKINKYRFQKQELQFQEFSDGSGLNLYEFKYRFDDPQIGRFWQVDPLASEYEYNSPYAFSEDKVTSDVELEGLEAIPIILPAVEAATAALFGGSMAAGHTQAPPSLHALGQDLTATGTAVKSVFIQDNAGYTPGGVEQGQMLWNKVVNFFSGKSNDNVPNPDGSKGKPDHQEKVKDLADKARSEAGPNETVLQEKKIQVDGSNRHPDVQIVDENGKTRKIYEAERRPNSKRNKLREQEYDQLGIEHETHPLEPLPSSITNPVITNPTPPPLVH